MFKSILPIVIAVCQFFSADISSNSTDLAAPEVCSWPDNKKAAVSITIDDGDYKSALAFNELFKKYDVRATEFLIAAAIEGKDDLIKDWNDLFSEGHLDLGNHSYSHELRYNEVDSYTNEQLEHDVNGSYDILKKAFPELDILSYATPWGQNNGIVTKIIEKNHYAIRGVGGDIAENQKWIDLQRLPSYVVTFGTTADELNRITDEAISGGDWFIQLHHAVGAEDSPADALTTNPKEFEEHLKYLNSRTQENDVWAGSFNDVAKYISERMWSKTTVLWSNRSSIGLNVTDKMEDNELFDYPLTLKVYLPESWTGRVRVSQGSMHETCTIEEENGQKFVYIHAVPDGGNIMVRKPILDSLFKIF